MLFTDLTFLYYFLPVTLAVVFLVPKNRRNAVILAASLLFYIWGEPVYWILMILLLLFCYGAGLLLEHTEQRKCGRRMVFAVSVAGMVSVLVFFKTTKTFLFPIGISFYTFQMISYLADIYRKRERAERNPVRFALYVALFPQLIAGPIVRYSQIAPQIRDRELSFAKTAYGIRRFCTGLAKKVILADTLAMLVEKAGAQTDLLGYLLAAVGFMMQIYYDFSGYSDMAIGLGSMMGFVLPENFHYPYVATSVTEFWRRWHMTLGIWFRDYVYIPLGGNRVGKGRWILNLLAVWLLTGFWHGASFDFILWGFYFCVLLIVEKLFRSTELCGKIPYKAKRIFGFLWTFFLVMAGFILFRENRVPITELDEIMTSLSLYYLRNNLGILFLSFLFMTPVICMIKKKYGGTTIYRVAEGVVCLLLFVLSTAFIVDSSFRPFLYFRF